MKVDDLVVCTARMFGHTVIIIGYIKSIEISAFLIRLSEYTPRIYEAREGSLIYKSKGVIPGWTSNNEGDKCAYVDRSQTETLDISDILKENL